jgi:hypothetical protein
MHTREVYAKREIRDLDPPSIPAPPCQYHVLYNAWQQISMPILVMWSACLLRHSPIIDGGGHSRSSADHSAISREMPASEASN